MMKFTVEPSTSLDHLPEFGFETPLAEHDQIVQLHNEIFDLNRRQLMQAGMALGSAGLFGFAAAGCKTPGVSGLRDATAAGAAGPGPKFRYFVEDYKNWITNLDKIYGMIAAQQKAAALQAAGQPAPSAQEMQAIAGQVTQSLAPYKFFTMLGGSEFIGVLKEIILDSDSPEEKKRKADNREKVVLRGKLLGKLISDWLANDPYRMFRQIRDPKGVLASITDSAEQSRISALYTELAKYGTLREGIFQPIVGPALITKNDQVRHVLQDLHFAFTVKPYFTEMRKTMKGEHRFFILGTDNNDEYEKDAIFLKGKFSKDGFDEELKGVANRDDLPMIKKLCRKAVGERVKKMTGGVIDAVALARYVPVDLIGTYFGVHVADGTGLPYGVLPGKNAGDTYKYSELNSGPFDGGKLGDTLNKVYYKVGKSGDKYTLDTSDLVALDEAGKPIPAGNPDRIPVADYEIKSGAEGSAGMSGADIPDEETMYQWLKNCFQNFFNNFQKEEQVQLAAQYSSFQVLSLVAVWVQAYKDAMENNNDKMPNGDAVPDNMITRLLRLQKKDPSNSRLSDTRIRENVFGIIAGAIINQEEQTARCVDALADLCDPNYKSDGTDGEDYLAAGQSGPDVGGAKSRRSPFFDASHKAELRKVCRADDDASYAKLRGYYNEAMRHRPQGEVLLRQQNYMVPVSPTSNKMKPGEYKDLKKKLAGTSFPPGQMVFVCQGSAMKDTDDSEKFIIDREERRFYIHHGYGRHRCLGQYISPLMTIETMRAIFAYDDTEKAESLEMDARGLYATKLKIKVSGSNS